uniref:Malonyl-CoA:ACP transacylase (MAT) domain-containing protein n=1 Tax=Panagrellus redivivus TaxID=6233 RepID=A0A7E4VQ53_PANRE
MQVSRSLITRFTPSSSFTVASRGVRRRPEPPLSGVPAGDPRKLLNDATTFSDVHSVILDPHDKLPYPAEQMQDFLVDNEREKVKSKAEKYKTRKLTQLNFDHIPIEDQVVALFPGQGAQHVGMGQKVIDTPAAKEIYDRAAEVLKYDILALCRDGPKTKLDQTIYCQPAVFVGSLAAYEKLKVEQPDLEDRLTDAAGFSVGEYAAMVASGAIDFETALKVVQIRAEAMHECNQRLPSGMLTVRVNAASKLDEAMAEARDAATEANELPLCEVANYLFCGVKVVGGSDRCLTFLEANAHRFNYTPVKRLAVSGAFHTRLMNPAVEIVRETLKGVKLNPPKCNVYSNYSGKVYSRKAGDIRKGLVQQISAPVKWEQIQQLLYRKHQDFKFPNYIEIGPGRQLGAMFVNISKKAYKAYTNYPC